MRLLAIDSYYKPAYVYGGPVRCDATLYENLVRLGVEITVITTNANNNNKLDVPLMTTLDISGVKVIYCPTVPALGSAFFSPAQIREAKRRIPQNDLVNLQTFWGYSTPFLYRYCRENYVPYYVTLHGQLMNYAMRHVGLTKRLKREYFSAWLVIII